jgi:predicted N-acetyltransferase YhbS
VAKPEDAESVSRLINDAFRSERFFSDEDRTNPGEVGDLMKKGIFLLAKEAGDMIACVYLEPRGDRFYLGLLSVEPSRQKSGMGSFLMNASEDYARSQGAHAMDLQIVNVRTELPSYYGRFGYVETGAIPFPPHKKTKMPCHLVIYSKNL